MFDLGAIGFNWGAYLVELILFGFPIGMLTYWITKARLEKKLRELEQRINEIELKR